MKLAELDYDLPEELIAQTPTERRDGARLLLLDKAKGSLTHGKITDLPGLVEKALFVVNDTRVFPARLRGAKATGGAVEVLLVERLGVETFPSGRRRERWLALGRASKGLKVGLSFGLGTATDGAHPVKAEVLGRRDDGSVELNLESTEDVLAFAEEQGELPLPPYVRRAPAPEDRERYQTIFANETGAVAAPTAGLHFSEELVAALEAAGHRIARVTLHVGPGTFRPVKHEDLDEHPMHEERFIVPEATVSAIAQARAEGRAIVAVGTTVVRTLEAAADPEHPGLPKVGPGRTRLFIKPPYEPKVVDHLLTNFHLPRSTLLALIMGLAGKDAVRRAYTAAVEERYRFFSYGDAMFLRHLR